MRTPSVDGVAPGTFSYTLILSGLDAVHMFLFSFLLA